MRFHRPPRYVAINPKATRFLNTCVACGRQGYSSNVAEPDFGRTLEFQAIQRTLTSRYEALPIDANGMCPSCGDIA